MFMLFYTSNSLDSLDFSPALPSSHQHVLTLAIARAVIARRTDALVSMLYSALFQDASVQL